ncbi:hypothetical protein [Cellulomonas sp.]|uniref:hypothetical protein n=1 Tax=Cellulomonas sp. TaxID=40001 RepID=UPI0025C151DE|nr:hypothetical protein [Cellulomonas sp.]
MPPLEVGETMPWTVGIVPTGPEEVAPMGLWLILIIVGVVMIVLGVAVTAAKVLLWIGIVLLVVSLIMALVSRGRSRV